MTRRTLFSALCLPLLAPLAKLVKYPWCEGTYVSRIGDSAEWTIEPPNPPMDSFYVVSTFTPKEPA